MSQTTLDMGMFNNNNPDLGSSGNPPAAVTIQKKAQSLPEAKNIPVIPIPIQAPSNPTVPMSKKKIQRKLLIWECLIVVNL